MPAGLVITCEHGGNRIPAAFAGSFDGREAVLASHRGFDRGALLMARALADAFSAPLVASRISRLLVDLNRSPGHPTLHDPRIRSLPERVRRMIVARYYTPYRNRVEARVAEAIARQGRAVHVASHSFTPELHGRVRPGDVGLLYDPARPGEVALCAAWQRALAKQAPALAVRRNDPYRGSGDGLTRLLRGRFDATCYVGIELEINQRCVRSRGRDWADLREVIVQSLRQALTERGAP